MSNPPDDLHPAARLLKAAGSVVLALTVCMAVWPFASTHQTEQFLLSCAVAVLAVLWASHAVVTGRLGLRPDPVLIALAGLALLSAAQLVPLPETAIGAVSPLRLSWYHEFVPAEPELLPGDPPVARADRVPVTVSPNDTRAFLSDVLGVLVVYAAARHWLGGPGALRRFAWALAANGTVLAVFSLVQFFTAPRNTLFWTYPLPGPGFGPFVCRNHYPDYTNFCLGLAVGLIFGASRRRADDEPATADPVTVLLPLAVGLMALSVPFSLSRAGTVCTLLAAGAVGGLYVRTNRGGPSNTPTFLFAAAVVGLLAVGFGWGAVTKRMASLVSEAELAREGRFEVWARTARLIPDALATGYGAGTFQWVETSTRETGSAEDRWVNAHNEYLEAVLDGGLVRLGLTLVLVGGPLVALARGAKRHAGGPDYGLLLGAWFAVFALALHCAVDFGVRNPAVAVIAAATTGLAMAAAAAPATGVDPSRPRRTGASGRQKVRVRVRVRKRISNSTSAAPGDGDPGNAEYGGEPGAATAPVATSVAAAEPADPEPVPPPPRPARVTAPDPDPLPADEGWVLKGPAALGFGLLLTAVALVIAADVRTRAVAERMQYAATALQRAGVPAAARVPYLAVRAKARPLDSDAQIELAQAQLAAAVSEAQLVGAAAAGPIALVTPVDAFSPVQLDGRAGAGLRAALAARADCVLNVKAHFILALYSESFTRAEPPTVYLDRARRLLSAEPYIWFKAGRVAFDRGDDAAAWANWRGAIDRGPLLTDRIVALARIRADATTIREHVLPDRPHPLVVTANMLLPRRGELTAERRAFLERAVDLGVEDRPWNELDYNMAAHAAVELGRTDDAVRLWDRGLVKYPRNPDLRFGVSGFYMNEERYADAIPHVNAMIAVAPNEAWLKERLEVCKHGLKLAKALQDPGKPR